MLRFRNRRRSLMGQAEAEPSSTPVTGLRWEIGRNLNSSGSNTSATYGACTYRIDAAGTKVQRTGLASYDGAAINCFLHEYDRTHTGLSSQGWIKRTQIYANDAAVTLGSTTTHIAFTFAFPSGAGKTMTQDIVDQCFGAEWV